MVSCYCHECSRRGGGGCRRDRSLFTIVLVTYTLVFSFLFYSVPYSPSPKRPFLEFLGIGSGSSSSNNKHQQRRDDDDDDVAVFPCAINFYGLPRSFKSLVLPFVIQNVLLPNARYNCDFFIHHHIRDVDPGGRDGRSGTIDPEDIFLLKEAILAVHSTNNVNNNNNAQMTRRRNVAPPLVVFANTTEEDFLRQYKSFLQEIHTARGPDGNLLYVPYRHPSYKKDTIDNVIKMWHGQESVWNLMVTASESSSWSQHHHHHPSQQQQQTPKHYSRVAMLRSDVVYVTPIDIFKIPARQKAKQQQQHPRKNKKNVFFPWLMTRRTKDDDNDNGSGGMDWDNSVAVIPSFARHPVNDRLIYGPYDAVKIWASERFLRLPRQHLRHLQQQQYDHNNNSTDKTTTGITLQQGDGIHSERFLCFTIFPAIRNAGIEIRNDPDLCFLRARADESIRFADCDLLHVTQNNHEFIETILNHHHHHGITATSTLATGDQQQQPQQRQSCLLNTNDRDRKLVQLECSQQDHLEIQQHDNAVNNRQAPMTLEWQKRMSPVNSNITWHKGCDPNNNKKGWRKASCPKQHEAWLLAI